VVDRKSLYEGEIRHTLPTQASQALVQQVLHLLRTTLGAEDVRSAQAHISAADFFAHMGRVRKTLFEEPVYRGAVRSVLSEGGFEASRIAFDPPKLRIISHDGHRDPRSAPVYYPHRDTWYGHPQSLLVWWIPLHDLAADETFVFYPNCFRQAVPNDSETFDYQTWTRDLRIGWQDREAGRTVRYPGVVGEVDPGPPLGFSCRQGDNLVFSGAHFHCTLPQTSGRTRFSIDFRFVCLDDEVGGLGAPNVDNRSRGSALPDYVHP
jgi:hypothetical protein